MIFTILSIYPVGYIIMLWYWYARDLLLLGDFLMMSIFSTCVQLQFSQPCSLETLMFPHRAIESGWLNAFVSKFLLQLKCMYLNLMLIKLKVQLFHYSCFTQIWGVHYHALAVCCPMVWLIAWIIHDSLYMRNSL